MSSPQDGSHPPLFLGPFNLSHMYQYSSNFSGPNLLTIINKPSIWEAKLKGAILSLEILIVPTSMKSLERC
jgi:hypothetical protein